MNFRAFLAAGLTMGLSACANDRPASAMLGAEPMGLASLVTGANAATPQSMPKKTMSDRVLAAIALERVTGLKPDPARFQQ